MVTNPSITLPQLLMNTGTSSGLAWVGVYGLDRKRAISPGFVVFSSGSKGASGGDSCWGSGFADGIPGCGFLVAAIRTVLSNPRAWTASCSAIPSMH
jgi:hypothetical protein